MAENSDANPPKIKLINSSSNEIMIPAEITKSIQVTLSHFDPIAKYVNYECCFVTENTTCVKASLLDETIYCAPYKFRYKHMVWFGEKKIGLIVRSDKYKITNPDDIHIITYRCQTLERSCPGCRTLDSKFMCGWCQNPNGCYHYGFNLCQSFLPPDEHC